MFTTITNIEATIGSGPTATSGVRAELLRRSNLRALVRELHLAGPRTRSQLGASTGLARSAIASLVGELVDLDLAIEQAAQTNGSPGRPSPVVSADARANVVLAMEVAGDSLAVAAIGLGGEVLAMTREPNRPAHRSAHRSAHRPASPRGRLDVEYVVGRLGTIAEAMLESLSRFRGPRSARDARGVVGAGLTGVGVAVAGVVDRQTSRVVFAPNLGWHDVPLDEMMRDRLALGAAMPVLVANEADLGTLAEARRGAARGIDDVLYLSGEVGVGGGLLVGGRALVGTSGFGGEVGHMVVDPTGARCHCGSTGCWETEIGEVAVLRRAGRRRRAGVDSIGQLIAAADSGDVAARAAAEATGHWLGLGIGNLINILNPRMVVLGGLFGRLHPHLRGAMMAELARRSLAPIRGDVTVVASQLGEQAALIGAAELAFDQVLDDPLAVGRLRR